MFLLRHLRRPWTFAIALALVFAMPAPTAQQEPIPRWLLGQAYHVPSEYTNQESCYFSIVEGHNGFIYVGTAKYGVNSFLIEFNPAKEIMRMVVDVHRAIMQFLKGFAAQAKIHTRNNVGKSGKIYIGSKQGYPEKNEKRTDYPGGYVLTYDPKTKKTEHFGIAKKHHGIISVIPDEDRGVAYISTCDDGRPIEHSHFMILDLKKKTYRDLGDTEHSYAFIVLDHKGRAYHPVRGGLIARYDPDADKLEKLPVTVDGAAPPKDITKDGAVLNWETSPDKKTLYAIEMSTNQLFAFDLTASGNSIPGKKLGALLPGAKSTDCRALAVSPKGIAWATVTMPGKEGAEFRLVSYQPGDKAPRDLGQVGIANPNFTPFKDAKGKPLPWHHCIRKAKDGTMVPFVPLGICAAHDGSVYAVTLAPLTVLRFSPEVLKKAQGTSTSKGEGEEKREMKRLEGTWKVVSAKMFRKEVTTEKDEPLLWMFRDDQLVAKSGGSERKQKFRLDISKKPKHIDLIDGKETIKGIYSLQGDELTLCLPLQFLITKNDRPPKLEVDPEGRSAFMVLKRILKRIKDDK